jgi:hypothetical protein
MRGPGCMKVKGLIATHVNGSYTAVDERETHSLATQPHSVTTKRNVNWEREMKHKNITGAHPAG